MSMRAIVIAGGKGPVESLLLGTAPKPRLAAPHHVLVKVKAFGLNRMDIFQRLGKYPVPKGASELLGVEFSGHIAQAGPAAGNWKEGDEVFGLATGGAYAEYIAVPQTHIMVKPSQLSWIEAASVPEAWLTAFCALVLSANIKKNDNVFISTGASGVGVAANQLARYLGAQTVITSAGTDDKLDWLRRMSLPPTHTVNYKTGDFAECIQQATGGQGVDVLIDFVGKAHWEKNISRWLWMAGWSFSHFLANMSLQQILYKRLRIEGSTHRSRSEKYQADSIERFSKEVLPDISGVDGSGRMKTYVHAVFPWAQIQDASRVLEANANMGKVVAEVVD
ncbi:quinone oxidoreductase putative [Auriculariales sp. MPI-PUGE-AT-0066]|nr:quinone oxidoreductase putative [Auriculariales sp. MPI-PUGE-AT-0066]